MEGGDDAARLKHHSELVRSYLENRLAAPVRVHDAHGPSYRSFVTDVREKGQERVVCTKAVHIETNVLEDSRTDEELTDAIGHLVGGRLSDRTTDSAITIGNAEPGRRVLGSFFGTIAILGVSTRGPSTTF